MSFIALMYLIFLSLKNNKVRELQWQPDGSWLIIEKNQQQTAELQSGSVVTPFFAALKFSLENNKKMNVVLFKDNIEVEKFRQLRVRMKVEGISIKPEL